MTTTICHLTTVHPRYDTRIFLKQARSLACSGYTVFLVVADGNGDERRGGVAILDAGRRATNRVARMTVTIRKVYRKALSTGAVIFHLHDPELIPIGLKLERRGYTVIFDAHEDLPKQLFGKHYLPSVIARGLTKVVAAYERFACARVDAVVAATPPIRDKFLTINHRTIDVNNFPILSELHREDSPVSDSTKSTVPTVCYVGGVGTIRGIFEMVRAMDLVRDHARLVIAGDFFQNSVAEAVQLLPGWRRVYHRGWVDREGVRSILHGSVAGLVTLHPTVNYVESLPVKMFEYMSAGIAVIASDFTLWREIVEGNECGICIDPTDPEAIAGAIDYMVEHPEEARRMGANGRKAVEARYNWTREEAMLLGLYKTLSTQTTGEI